jgi:hypothetical protein
MFLVLWSYVLVTMILTDSKISKPRLSNLPAAFSLSLGKVAGFVLAVIIVALFMHPLQFGMTQLLEGYWGTRRVPLALSVIRTNVYRRRARYLNELADKHESEIMRTAGHEGKDQQDLTKQEKAKLDALLRSRPGDAVIGHVIERAEAQRKRAEFPNRADLIMPTRLGNALRSFEREAGQQYGINAIPTAPHLSLVAQPEHAQYAEDSRQQMDTAIRLCVVSIIATVETVALLLTEGPWLFLALVPYGLAYLAYRGAVSAARGYGTAIQTVIDLNRFALYDSLNVRRPGSLREEQKLNETLMDVLEGDRDAPLRYKLEPEAYPERER